MTHPSDVELAALAQGLLDDTRRLELEAHVDGCSECLEVLAGVVRADAQANAPGRFERGRFRLIEPAGAGGLGEVYAAWDSVLERAVALKWLFPAMSDDDRTERRQRLLREARALAKVRHPNVVAVYDVLEASAEGVVATPEASALRDMLEHADVLVMELVPRARSFRSLAGTDWRAAVTAFIGACRGVAAAHAAGVVHGDLKPDNMLLRHDGRAVVCDFGLASVHSGPSAKVSGTPAYLAPERWTGSEPSAAADQFSLAVAFFELLAGVRPFPVRAPASLVQAGPPPLPLSVPRELIPVLSRALSHAPNERWPNIEAFGQALEATLSTPRETGSGKLLIVTAGLVALVLSGSLGWRWKTRCDDAGAAVSAVWSGERRESVERAIQTESGSDLAPRVLAGLDAWAARLTTQRHDACVATAFQGDPAEALSQRTLCLAKRLAEFDALSTELTHATPQTAERSLAALEALSSVDCLALVSGRAAMPVPLALRDTVAAIETTLSEVRAKRHLGEVKASEALAKSAVERAEATGWRALIADASFEWGMGLSRLGRNAEASAALTRAVQLALEVESWRTAYFAAVHLAFIESNTDVGRAKAWASVARGLIAPAHVDGTPNALRVDTAEAAIEFNEGHLEEAARRFQASVTRLEALKAERTFNGARELTNVGAAHARLGHFDDAIRTLRRARDIFREVGGATHSETAAASLNLGQVLGAVGQFAEARTLLVESLQLRERVAGADAPVLASNFCSLCELEYREEHFTEAVSACQRALELERNAKRPEGDASLLLGAARSRLNQHAEAVQWLERVLPLAEPRASPWNLEEARLTLAASLLASGNSERVAGLLEAVLRRAGPTHERQRGRALELKDRLSKASE